MTQEQICIDLIFTALSNATERQADEHDKLIAQLAITFGIGVMLCVANDISEETAVEVLRSRFRDAKGLWDETRQ